MSKGNDINNTHKRSIRLPSGRVRGMIADIINSLQPGRETGLTDSLPSTRESGSTDTQLHEQEHAKQNAPHLHQQEEPHHDHQQTENHQQDKQHQVQQRQEEHHYQQLPTCPLSLSLNPPPSPPSPITPTRPREQTLYPFPRHQNRLEQRKGEKS